MPRRCGLLKRKMKYKITDRCKNPATVKVKPTALDVQTYPSPAMYLGIGTGLRSGYRITLREQP